MGNAALSIQIIANPAAHNGEAAHAIEWLQTHAVPMNRFGSRQANITITRTERAGDASRIARTCSADIVIALGGDGIAHECAQGLMPRPQSERPVFGLLPFEGVA